MLATFRPITKPFSPSIRPSQTHSVDIMIKCVAKIELITSFDVTRGIPCESIYIVMWRGSTTMEVHRKQEPGKGSGSSRWTIIRYVWQKLKALVTEETMSSFVWNGYYFEVGILALISRARVIYELWKMTGKIWVGDTRMKSTFTIAC